MTVNELMRRLVADLEAEGVPDPLRQPLTLAAVWADLCKLHLERPPAAVLVALDDPERVYGREGRVWQHIRTRVRKEPRVRIKV